MPDKDKTEIDIAEKSDESSHLAALAGNPNVGKSTIFNALTGMKQHTGNWAGKTVASAEGRFTHNNESFILADIPGTYSLRANSAEEEAARDFICFGGAEAAIVVCDATCLERNLNLVLQVTEASEKTIVCVNLLDEAKSKGISIDLEKLSELLGSPVVGVTARSGQGLDRLSDVLCETVGSDEKNLRKTAALPEEIENAVSEIEEIISEYVHKLPLRLAALRILEGDDNFLKKAEDFENCRFSQLGGISQIKEKLSEDGYSSRKVTDTVISAVIKRAEKIASEVVSCERSAPYMRDRKLDRIFAGKRLGTPVMILLLGVILWITIAGANYPSDLLSSALFGLGDILSAALERLGAPERLESVLIQGIYKVLAWVVSVMLPPMADYNKNRKCKKRVKNTCFLHFFFI